jgi:acyl carrier protein
MSEEVVIKNYICESILFTKDGYPYPDDTPFFDEGILDSTGVLELVLLIEETYGLTVDTKDLLPENFGSVARLATYVRRRLAVAV